jgi:hypothetical protein
MAKGVGSVTTPIILGGLQIPREGEAWQADSACDAIKLFRRNFRDIPALGNSEVIEAFGASRQGGV